MGFVIEIAVFSFLIDGLQLSSLLVNYSPQFLYLFSLFLDFLFKRTYFLLINGILYLANFRKKLLDLLLYSAFKHTMFLVKLGHQLINFLHMLIAALFTFVHHFCLVLEVALL